MVRLDITPIVKPPSVRLHEVEAALRRHVTAQGRLCLIRFFAAVLNAPSAPPQPVR